MQRIGTDGRKRIIFAVIFVVIALVLILVDRLTKNYFAKLFEYNFDTYQRKYVINNFFFFTLKANEGAAWSFLSNKNWAQTFFKILTVVALVVISFAFYFGVKKNAKWLQSGLSLMFAGAIGNFIDRLAFNYVIDFIGFKFGNYVFPIFNVADICLCVGTIMIVIYLLFLDNNAIFKRNEKNKDSNEKQPAD